MQSVTDLTTEEVAGLLVIAVIAGMIGWFATDSGVGTTRPTTAVIAAVVAFVVALVTLLVLR